MGPGASGPVVSLFDEVEFVSVDGLGGSDNTLVNLLEGSDVQRVIVNPSDNLNRDFVEDRIILWGSTVPDQLVVEQLEVDIELVDITCVIDRTGQEICTEEFAQGGSMRVSDFPTVVFATVGEFPYDVILMNFDDHLLVNAGLGDDDVDVLGITGPTTVDGGPDNDLFDVTPTGPLDFLAELVIDGGSGSNRLHADHRGVTTSENVVVSDATVLSDTLPAVNYGSSQLGNFEPGVIVTGTAMDDAIDVISTRRGDTTIVAGDARSDTIEVGSGAGTPGESHLASIAGRLLTDGGSGVNDALQIIDSAATQGNTDVRLDLVGVPEVPGDIGVEITGLAGPIDDASIVYKANTFQQVRIESSDDSGVAETFRVLNTDSAHLILDEQSGDAEFFLEQAQGHVEIHGGLGNEVARLTQQSENLDDLGHGPVTFLGGGGTDRLEVFDKNAAGGTTYQFFDQSLLRTAGPGLPMNFDAALERFVLQTTDANDAVSVVQMPVAAAINVDQGMGLNTLVGPNIANTWQITELDGGTLNNKLSFEHSGMLIGGSGNNEFRMEDAAGVTGSITGSSSAGDVLDYSAYSTSVIFDLTALPLGAASAANVPEFFEVDRVIGGAAINTVLGPTSVDAFWTVDQPGAGSVATQVQQVEFEAITRLVGGNMQDYITLAEAGTISTINGTADANSSQDGQLPVLPF